MDKFLTRTVRAMQQALESISGKRVHYSPIALPSGELSHPQGSYHFDGKHGHIIGLCEVRDGFDELRTAIELSHGLLFFEGYAGVLLAPGGKVEVAQIPTDTTHHPAMRRILSSYGFETVFGEYYEWRTQQWVNNVEELSAMCNKGVGARIRMAFFMLEAMLVDGGFRLPLLKAFASKTENTWAVAEESYSALYPFYPPDQLRLRKAIVYCLGMLAKLGMDTRLAIVPPVIEKEEKPLRYSDVFDVEERGGSDIGCDVSIRYRRDGTLCTIIGIDYPVDKLREAIGSRSASEVCDLINASLRGGDWDSLLRSPTGSE